MHRRTFQVVSAFKRLIYSFHFRGQFSDSWVSPIGRSVRKRNITASRSPGATPNRPL